MSVTPTGAIEDLSAFVVAGRLRSHLHERPEFETSVRTPAHALTDGVDAERLGYRRVFVAERPDLKDVPTLLSGIAARTERVGVASGIVATSARHPMLTASFGATMQATYGPRFTLGLGRGAPLYGHGGSTSFDAFADYCTTVRRIWEGEHFEHPVYGTVGLNDRYEGDHHPEILFGGFGLPRGARMVAETPAIDGILLPAMLTPTGAGRAVANVRAACERAGRDPASVRVLAEVVTAPGLSEGETRQLAHARAVTYLQPPAWGRAYEILNGWDPEVLQQLRAHAQLRGVGEALADLRYHRKDLVDPSRILPDEWIEDACAIGDVDRCVRKLEAFRAAGVDEITTYGSTPAQNAALLEAWRRRAVAAQAQ